ncbi:MAG: class I SAM-dependent methyltransferase family protein [Candidatus Aenigmarchaeota archaeon]|nr:class I SAM-dependent methyltransferase family protein [Candidatus Aenigmarchaeota archaeon]
MNLKEYLNGKLTDDELKKLVKSFDIVGSKEKSVAIIEIPEELHSKEKLIAEAITKVHKNVKSVLKQMSPREGELRLRKYEVIFGEKNTEVLHKESGCRFLLDPQKVYFSVREGSERLRIAKKVRNGEKVLIMFGGVAPFPIVIARKSNASIIYSVELNKKAHEYAVKNVHLNKVDNRVVPVLGSVRDVCPSLNEKFDRIIMPLPESAYKFLDLAFSYSKKGTIIHLYGISEEKNLFKDLEEKVKSAVNGKKYEIIEKKKVLPYGPRKWKVRLDIKVL